MSGGEVVADCDAMNFALVHHRLRDDVLRLLVACDWRVITLDAIYRREAQAALRTELEALRAQGRCELVELPSRRELEKKQRKLWQQIDQLAQRRFRVVSENDRALLFEASDRSILLVSGDGPLQRLAIERGQIVLDVLDLIAILYARGIIDAERYHALLAREAERRGDNVESVAAALTSRGRDHWPCAA